MSASNVAKAALAAALAIGIVVWLAGGGAFRESFGANLAGTVVGFLVGIPFAVFLLGEQRRSEGDAAERRAKERLGEVLVAVRREVKDNLADLADRTVDGQRVVKVPVLGSEVWQAVSDSGGLETIRDPELFRRLTRAYRFLGQTRFLEEQAIRTMTSGGHSPHLAQLAGSDPVTKAALDEGVAAIDAELQRLGMPIPPDY